MSTPSWCRSVKPIDPSCRTVIGRVIKTAVARLTDAMNAAAGCTSPARNSGKHSLQQKPPVILSDRHQEYRLGAQLFMFDIENRLHRFRVRITGEKQRKRRAARWTCRAAELLHLDQFRCGFRHLFLTQSKILAGQCLEIGCGEFFGHIVLGSFRLADWLVESAPGCHSSRS